MADVWQIYDSYMMLMPLRYPTTRLGKLMRASSLAKVKSKRKSTHSYYCRLEVLGSQVPRPKSRGLLIDFDLNPFLSPDP